MTQTNQDVSLKSLFFPFTTTKAIHYLFFIGIIVYGNTLWNGFVWDDFSNIIYNAQTHVLSVQNIFGQSIINTGLQYRPLVALYFSLLYTLFGDVPLFYHICNVLFHIGNSILVFFLLKKFFTNPISFFLAAIFLVHPMQVESATFIATAGNLYFFFGLLAFLLYLKYPKNIRVLCLICGLFFLSFLAKETGILFLIMLFVWQLFYRTHSFKTLTYISLATILPYLLLRFFVGTNVINTHSAIIPIANLSPTQRLLTIPAVVFYYLKTFFYPKDLAIMQHWVIQKMTIPTVIMPLLIDFSFVLFFVISIVVIYKRHHQQGIQALFLFLWFISGILLHIQIFPLNMTVADRWFYFPMVGLLGLVGLLLQTIATKKMIGVFCILIIIVLSIRTVTRNTDWRDDLTLYNHDKHIHDNFIIENNIGWNYQHIHDFNTALPYYQRSVAMFSGWAISLNNLGFTYEVLGEKTKARTVLVKVLTANDYHQKEYSSDLAFTAWALTTYDDPALAKQFTTQALKAAPDNPFLWVHLARCEYALHHQQAAEYAAKKATTLSNNPLIASFYTLIVQKQPIPQNISLIN